VGEAKFFDKGGCGIGGRESPFGAEGKEARTVELPIEMIRKANLVVEF